MRLLLGAVNAGLGLMIFTMIAANDGWRDIDSLLLAGLMIITGTHLLTPTLARRLRRPTAKPSVSEGYQASDAIGRTSATR